MIDANETQPTTTTRKATPKATVRAKKKVAKRAPRGSAAAAKAPRKRKAAVAVRKVRGGKVGLALGEASSYLLLDARKALRLASEIITAAA